MGSTGTNKLSKDIDAINAKGFVEAAKTITGIAVKTNPTKITYDHGEAINLTGGEITVTYDDGSTEDVSMSDSNISISKNPTAKASDPNVQISYKGKTAAFPITVNDPVVSIAVSGMNPVEYDHNTPINFDTVVITATKKSGATDTFTKDSPGISVSETVASVDSPKFTPNSASTDTDKKGSQVITFTYSKDGVTKTAEQTITVNDKIKSLHVIKQPTKTVYKYQDTAVSYAGAQVEITYQSNATHTINLPDGSVNVGKYSNTTIGRKQSLAVSIGSITADNTIDLEFYNYITNATLSKPTKSKYNLGETLDVTNGRILVTWKAGGSSNVTLTDDMCSGYNISTKGRQTVTVKYDPNYTLSDGTVISDEKTFTYPIEVVNGVTAIAITIPDKNVYKYSESLDIPAGNKRITVTYADGTTTTKDITADMIEDPDVASGFTTSPELAKFGTAPTYSTTYNKTLTITYEEGEVSKTENYPVTILNDVKTAKIVDTPKVTYNVNEALDLTRRKHRNNKRSRKQRNNLNDRYFKSYSYRI